MTRVVLAPDSFKGSLRATQVAAALARGWRTVRPDDDVVEVPLADGGEGSLDAFVRAVPGAVRHRLEVPGPDGRPTHASWLALPDGTAVIELACASGLTLLGSPAPLDAHTRGVGEVLRAALAAGPRRVVVALGGSASTDGGAGLLRALGARVLDADGVDVPDGGRGLVRAAHVDLAGLPAPAPGGVEVLCDVTSPLLGPTGAAAVFGPQKGATPDDVRFLDEALGRWAVLLGEAVTGAGTAAPLVAGTASGRAAGPGAEVPRGTTVPDAGAPGAGAAGGTAFGLLAWGARLVPGASAIADVVGLDALLPSAGLVVTGEGRLDAQSAVGKAPAEVARRARRAGVRLALVVGQAEPGASDALAPDAPPELVELAHLAGSADAALADPTRWLEAAGARLAASLR